MSGALGGATLVVVLTALSAVRTGWVLVDHAERVVASNVGWTET